MTGGKRCKSGCCAGFEGLGHFCALPGAGGCATSAEVPDQAFVPQGLQDLRDAEATPVMVWGIGKLAGLSPLLPVLKQAIIRQAQLGESKAMVKRLETGSSQDSYCGEIRRQMAALDADLPPLLLQLIDWLETNDHAARFPQGLLVAPRPNRYGELNSFIRFEFPQKNFMDHWLGKSGYERRVIPFIACAADGSYIALWHTGDLASDQFVFLGSEGECFTIANKIHDLIALVTMGYHEIFGRHTLSLSPKEGWELDGDEEPWSEPAGLSNLMAWARREAGISYPTKGSDILPFTPEHDPFVAFVNSIVDE